MKNWNRIIALMIVFVMVLTIFSVSSAEEILKEQIKALTQKGSVLSDEDDTKAETSQTAKDDQVVEIRDREYSIENEHSEDDLNVEDSLEIASRSGFQPGLMLANSGTKVYSDSRQSSLIGTLQRGGVVYAVSSTGNVYRIAFVAGNEVVEGYVSNNSLKYMNEETKDTYLAAASRGKRVYSQNLLGVSFSKASNTYTAVPTKTSQPTPTKSPIATPTVKVTPVPTSIATATPTPVITKAPVTVVPSGYPTIEEQPKSVQTLSGKAVVFSVKATNVKSYQWQYSTDGGSTWRDVSNDSIWVGSQKSSLSFIYKKRYEGYFFRCKLTNKAGTIYSNAAALDLNGQLSYAPSIITHPQNVSAKEGTSVSFQIIASGANDYQWQFSSNGSDWKNLSGSNWSGITSDSLLFISSQAYNGYLFRCAVSNTAGTVYSNNAQLTVIKASLPQIVLQPSSVNVKLNETASFSVQAEDSSAYQWEYSQNGNSWTALTDSNIWKGLKTSTLSFRVTDSRYASYLYRVKISNSFGSVYSNSVSVSVISTTTVAPTLKPTVSPTAVPTASVKSAPVFDTNINSFVTGEIGSSVTLKAIVSGATSYQWQVDPDAGIWANVRESTKYQNPTSASLTVKITSTVLRYSYRLKATNAYGTSYSQVFTLGEKIAAPTNVKVTTSSLHEINVTWTASANTSVNRYRVYYNTINQADYGHYVVTETNSVRLQGLNAGTTYFIWVQAIGDGCQSEVVGTAHATISTLATLSKPGAPSSVSVTASVVSLSVSWNKPANSIIDGYIVYYRPYPSNSSNQIAVNGENSLSAVIDGLTPNTSYQIWVCATNAAGEGNASASKVVKTLTALAAPAQPTNVKAVSAGSNSVKVSWTGSTSSNVMGYSVYYSTSSSVSSATKLNGTFGANTTSATVTGLSTGITYYFWVAAYNSNQTESALDLNVRASAVPKSTSTSGSNKINAEYFSKMGDKYLGTSYSVYDCQAFVERMLADAGLRMDLAGSNAWYRTMSWRGTPEQCIAKFGCIPTGAFLFIVKHDGGEPSHYNDSLGNASHIGVVTHRNGGAIHSSYSRGGVYTSVFNDATIPNGGWNMIGLWTRMDYGETVNSILEGR